MLHSALLPFAILAAPCQSDEIEAYRYLSGLHEQGLWDLAANECQAFLKRFPQSSKTDWVRYRLADAYFEMDRLGDAAPHFEALRTLADFEFQPECQLRAGQCAWHAGKTAEARAAWTALERGKAEYLQPTVRCLLGELEFQQRDFAAALAWYDKALAGSLDGGLAATATRSRVWCLTRLERWQEGQQAATALLAKSAPGESRAELHYLIGENQAGAGQLAKAIESYGKVDVGPYALTALNAKALLLGRVQNHEAAQAAFAQVLAADPNGPFAAQALLQRCAHLLQLGRSREALAILPEQSTDPEVLYWRSAALRAESRPEEALAAVQRALKLSKDEEQRLRLVGLQGGLLHDLGRSAEAAQAFAQSGGDYGLYAAAQASLDAGNAEEALRLCQSFQEAHPDSPYRLATARIAGEALFQLGRFEEAEPIFDTLRNNEQAPAPDRAVAASRYAWCCYRRGDLAKAQAAFATFGKKHADHALAAESALLAARCLRETGAMDAARKAFAAWVQAHPGDDLEPAALLELGGLQEDPAAWRDLLQRHPDSAQALQALRGLASWYEAHENWPEAAENHRRFLERAPQDPGADESRYGLAWCLHQSGAAGEALEVLAPLCAAGTQSNWSGPAAELATWCAAETGDLEAAQASYRLAREGSADALALWPVTDRLVTALAATEGDKQAVQILRSWQGAQQSEELRRLATGRLFWLLLDGGDVAGAGREAARLQQTSLPTPTPAKPTLPGRSPLRSGRLGPGRRGVPGLPRKRTLPATRPSPLQTRLRPFATRAMGPRPCRLRSPGRRTTAERTARESLYLWGECAWRANGPSRG
ncbi:MAG: tetratricopeptide repeat protein [Planctomycetota bacterium]